MSSGSPQRVGIVVFDGVERLDVEGPVGVLAWAARFARQAISFTILSKNGDAVVDHLIKRKIPVDGGADSFDGFDLLLVPGGDIAEFADDPELIAQVTRLASASGLVASVCTGAFLVAQTGLANGKSMATHWNFHQPFRSRFPHVTLSSDRTVKDGALWSSAGISAGIDMALRLVIDRWGEGIARQAQGALEYFPEPPSTRANVAPPQ